MSYRLRRRFAVQVVESFIFKASRLVEIESQILN